MTPEDLELIREEKSMTRESLLEVIVALKKKALENAAYRAEKESYLIENENAMKRMSLDYRKIQDERDALKKENSELKAKIILIAEKEQLRTEDLYGQSSEKMKNLLDHHEPDVFEDEAETEPAGADDSPSAGRTAAGETGKRKAGPHGARSAKKTGRLDINKLMQRYGFDIDIEELDRKYGNDWRIIGWHVTRTIEHPVLPAYCYNLYKPVLSIGLEHRMKSLPLSNDKLVAKSYASASTVSFMAYLRYDLGLPTYRIERYYRDFGADISRQTICNWLMRISEDCLGLIYDRLRELLLAIPYHQCDETYFHVINDGRKSGSNSYMWVHRTSELLKCNPIILFCFELTRGTDHLRKFYEDFKGFITCDGYISYKTLGKELFGIIIICGCMMHLRRRFAESLSLKDLDGMSEDDINGLAEVKALKMLGEIYDADEPLKNLSVDERKTRRQSEVRPLVEKFYAFVESIDTDDPSVSNRLKDAIEYSKNQKEYICRFLEDGNVPIDDGATERSIRPFALLRKSCMFFDSIRGAKAAAVYYSLIETAKANGANPYYYLKYVLEVMPSHMDDTDLKFIDDLLPWSDGYRAYEKSQMEMSPDEAFRGVSKQDLELPKTPRKRKPKSDKLRPPDVA